MSQSSRLTNDTQPLISSTTNEKTITITTTTPARVSYRNNPDGSRVSISRPAISTNHQSPLRRVRNQFLFLHLSFDFLNSFYRYRRMLIL